MVEKWKKTKKMKFDQDVTCFSILVKVKSLVILSVIFSFLFQKKKLWGPGQAIRLKNKDKAINANSLLVAWGKMRGLYTYADEVKNRWLKLCNVRLKLHIAKSLYKWSKFLHTNNKNKKRKIKRIWYYGENSLKECSDGKNTLRQIWASSLSLLVVLQL